MSAPVGAPSQRRCYIGLDPVLGSPSVACLERLGRPFLACQLSFWPADPYAKASVKVLPIPALRIQEPGAHLPHGWAFLRLGFRPFYLGAALFATLAVPAWVLTLLGYLVWTPAMAPLLWHAHEMLYGFVGAVVIGFLMTAGKAWTGLATPRGAHLGALAALWLAARLAALGAPYLLYAALDVALLPLVAAVLLRLLLRAGNHRNLPLAGLLLLMALANAAFHGAVLGWLDAAPLSALHAMLALVVVLECVMAGRVIPGFTMGALPGVKITPLPWLERSVLAHTAAGLGMWLFAPAVLAPVTALVLAGAAVLHLARQWRWSPWATAARPMVWVLQVAYLWFALGLGLLALAQLGLVGASAGIHSLAVGATAGLVLGMMTRTARGHTGRLVQAGPREVAAFALLIAAALCRVVWPLVMPEQLVGALLCAALAWAGAFGLYGLTYGPWLLQTRLDGRDG